MSGYAHPKCPRVSVEDLAFGMGPLSPAPCQRRTVTKGQGTGLHTTRGIKLCDLPSARSTLATLVKAVPWRVPSSCPTLVVSASPESVILHRNLEGVTREYRHAVASFHRSAELNT